MSATCPVALCGGRKRSGHLMCKTCWSMVPAALQRTVNQTWAAYLRSPAETILRDFGAYQAAREVAIKAAEGARP